MGIEASIFFFNKLYPVPLNLRANYVVLLVTTWRTDMTVKKIPTYSIPTIRERIAIATRQSSITVFRVKIEKKYHLTCVFTNTVQTQQRIRDNDEDLIGTFNRFTAQRTVNGVLRMALK